MGKIDFAFKLFVVVVIGLVAVLGINDIHSKYKEDFLNSSVLNQLGCEIIFLYALVAMLATVGLGYSFQQADKFKKLQDQITYIKDHYKEKQYYVVIKNMDSEGVVGFKYINIGYEGYNASPYVVDKKDATSYSYSDAKELAKQVAGQVIEK